VTLIFLGFKGVGKTTFGKKIASILKWDFLDTDDLIKDLYIELGHDFQKVHEIHKKLGEASFRKLEAQALRTLRPADNRIIAIGGGTVLNAESVELLRNLGRFVYLSKDKEAVRREHKSGKVPSFLDPDDFDHSFDSMYNERLAIYESLAAYTINVSSHKEAEILAKLYELAFKS